MTIHREWQHSTAYADATGVASASAAVAGNVIVTGGGYAEPVDYSNGNVSSTETNGASASARCPIVWIHSSYDGVGNTTYLNVGYATVPNAKVRAHVFVQWEA